MTDENTSEAEVIDVTAKTSFWTQHFHKAFIIVIIFVFCAFGTILWFGNEKIQQNTDDKKQLEHKLKELSGKLHIVTEALDDERKARVSAVNETTVLKNQIKTLKEDVVKLDADLIEAYASNASIDDTMTQSQTLQNKILSPPLTNSSSKQDEAESAQEFKKMGFSAQTIHAFYAVRLGFLTGDFPQQALLTLDEILPLPEELSRLEDEFNGIKKLQAEFPALARQAVKQGAYEIKPESLITHAYAFLKSQISIRSLQPRAGDSTDAILSRAEAELAQGALDKSLKEMEGLSSEVKEIFSIWRKKAFYYQKVWRAFVDYENAFLARENG